MDEFDNFFDDQRGNQNNRTPIYHTPEPKHKDKATLASIVCIAMAVLMCLVVAINVIVLSTLKDKIASEYAQTLSSQMREEYAQAINGALSQTDIVDDITNAGVNKALDALNSSVGQVANQKSASVARLYMYESTNSTSYGLASGFLITDTNVLQTQQRYIVTNAHCVRYAKKQTSSYPSLGGLIGGGQTTYQWATYGKIVAVFENDSNKYTLEVVAFGSYSDTDDNNKVVLEPENDMPDLAILRVVGLQPSNEAHPSLPIASVGNAVSRGSSVALIGNPEGVGKTNSVSSGCVSQTGITISSWGSGEFIMTDAAVNGGNSGGPMINTQGVVVGVVESKLVDEEIDNMGFALSAKTLIEFIEWASKAQNNQLHINLTIHYTLA